MKTKIISVAAAMVLLAAPCAAQTTVTGQPIVPLGYWQIPASALASAVKLSTACNIGSPVLDVVFYR